MIYLDNAATTYYKPLQVKQAVNIAMNLYTANAGRGAHKLAQVSAEKIFAVREKVLKFFNAKNHDCIFTAGCTSALNLAILGSVKKGEHIITTYLEHNSILRPLEHLKNLGQIEYSVVDKLDSSTIENAIQPNTYMIITTQVSNVTGEKLNLKEINKICKKYNLIHLIDTAQSAGHIFEDISYADLIAFAGHKGLYGLSGVGGLIVKKGIKLNPIMFGGTGTASESLVQPNIIPESFEVGTCANIPIISLGAGIDYVNKNKKYIIEKEDLLNNAIKNMLKNLNFVSVYNIEKAEGVYSFNVLNYDSSFVSDYLNENFNICTRAGLHCAPLAHKHFKNLTRGAVRISISSDNTIEDVLILEKALKDLYDKSITLVK